MRVGSFGAASYRGPLVHGPLAPRARVNGQDCDFGTFRAGGAGPKPGGGGGKEAARDKIATGSSRWDWRRRGAWDYWIPVKAGAVHKFLETRRYKQKVRYIRTIPQTILHVRRQVSIDEDSNVQYKSCRRPLAL